jgi:hypothetical protein
VALLFDGIDDRAMTESITGIPTIWPMTLAAVLKRGANPAGNTGVLATGFGGAGQGNRMQLAGATAALRLGAGSGVTSTVLLPLDQAAFCAIAVLDNTNKRFYVYNYQTRAEQLQFVATSQAPGAVASPKLKIGCQSAAGGDLTFSSFYTGEIVWVAIWDRYFGSAGDGYDQLRALAHLGPRAMGKPAFLAEFLEGQGSTVYDRSGNGNHATMSNFPASPWQPVGLPGPWWTRRPRYVTRGSASWTGGVVRPYGLALSTPRASGMVVTRSMAEGLAFSAPRASGLAVMAAKADGVAVATPRATNVRLDA